MKNLKKTILTLLLILVFVGIATLAFACNPDDNPDNPNSDGGQPITYTITLQRSGGQPFSNVAVEVYKDGARKGFMATNEDGVATFNLPKANYDLKFTSNLPTGYNGTGYTISGDHPNRTYKLSASLINDEMPADKIYGIGDVLYDFSFKDSQNRSHSISEILTTRKGVLLNFWYDGCSACEDEFPDMLKSYEQYKDDVEVVCITPYDKRTSVEAFRTNANGFHNWSELTFLMVPNENACASALALAFQVSGYPTSVLVDREGVICDIEKGRGYQDDFNRWFDEMIADPYIQKIHFPGEAVLDEPDVDAPTPEEISAAITDATSGIEVSYNFDTDKYNWPWVVSEDDEHAIMAANKGHNNSYAILYANVTAPVGKCIAFDYKVSCEADYDMFSVFVDGLLTHSFSGVNNNYKTCYAFVPVKDGTYQIGLAYIKDGGNSDGDDTVLVKNLRLIDVSEINERTEIIYRCIGGEVKNHHYTDYITPVYNSEDGYYHVGAANGPLVLADLMNPSSWSDNSVWAYTSAEEYLSDSAIDAGEMGPLTRYCNYANSSRRYGLVAATQELKDLVYNVVINKYDKNKDDRTWLEFCYYIVVYGGEEGEMIEDPIRGIAPHCAYETTLTENLNDIKYNHVVKETIIMPRGVMFKFVPDKTGVYKVYTVGPNDTFIWIADAKRHIIAENDDDDNYKGKDPEAVFNASIVIRLEKGKTYYLLFDYNNPTAMGEFDFIITYLANDGYIWSSAAGGEYTSQLDEQGNVIGPAVAGAIDYILDPTDHCYYAKNADGTKGSKIYIDMTHKTSMFPDLTLETMIGLERYYCKYCGTLYNGSIVEFESADKPFCWVCGNDDKEYFEKIDAFNLPTPVRDKNDGGVMILPITLGEGDFSVTDWVALFKVKEVGDNYDYNKYEDAYQDYGIDFTNYTSVMQSYLAKAKDENSCPKVLELDGSETTQLGFVEATEELVEILNKFIIFGSYSLSPSIDNAWLMLARYYKYIG